jgi:sugar lactone lactonase YvrE
MADVTVFDGRVCELGEGPFYDEVTDRVVWVDILGRRVLWRQGHAAGQMRVGAHVGAAVPRRDGGLVICLPEGPVLLEAMDSTDPWLPLGSFASADRTAGVPAPADGPTLRANDAKADPAGRLWLGTMAYDGTPEAGALYRLDPDETTPKRMLGGVTISNGLGWSPDRSTMYYIDTPTKRIDRIEYDEATGDLGERRLFAEVDEGYPDGLCVDADGGVWVALWEGGAVRRYDPDGGLDRVVRIPTGRVTSCAFVGDGYRTLVVTTAAHGRARDPNAGLTYAYEPGDVAGLPVDRFAG